MKTKICTKCGKKKPATVEYFHRRSDNNNKFRSRCIKCVIEHKLEVRYGITQIEYNLMFRQQDGHCAICGKPEARIDKRNNKINKLSVDHNHKTGMVRGLLCKKCNRLISGIEGLIDKINEYLKGYERK